MLVAARRMQRSEDGQAIVLAVIGMLVLALAVLTTMNIGTAVHDRIAVQNAADAKAYSLAVQEARAFNFYAFSNRAQASHYVSAMLMQSWLSFLNFLMSSIADCLSLFKTLRGTECGDGNGQGGTCRSKCETISKINGLMWRVLELIPKVAQLKGELDAIHSALSGVYQYLAERYDKVDEIFSTAVVPACAIANYFSYVTEASVFEAVRAQLAPGGAPGAPDVAADNDPAARDGAFAADFAKLNAETHPNKKLVGFLDAHDPASRPDEGGLLDQWRKPYGDPRVEPDPKVADARRVMTAMANASRYPMFVTDRNIFDWDDQLAGALGPNFDKFRRMARDYAESKAAFRIRKYGQTKMLTHPGPYWIRDVSEPNGNYPTGSTMTADDPYYLTLKPWLLDSIRRIIGGQSGADVQRYFYWGTVGVAWTFEPNERLETKEIMNWPYNPANSKGTLDPSLAMKDAEPTTGAVGATLGERAEPHQWVSVWGVNGDGGVHCGVGNNLDCQNQLCTKPEDRNALHNVCGWPIWWAHHSCWAESSSDKTAANPRHLWFGVTPYMKFNATPSRELDFGEPSVWVSTAHAVDATENKVTVLHRQVTAVKFADVEGKLQLANAAASLLAPGTYQAIARAKVYYHRPGTWSEHPNFFNPYWGARLEAIAPAVPALREEVPAIGALVDAFNGVTGSDREKNWLILH